MAYTTVLSNKQSTVGSPYVIYTVQLQPSSRTASTVNIDCIVTLHLSSSSSHLGTGHVLTGYIKINDQIFSIDLKGWSESWDGTTNHTASTSFQVTGLSSSTTSLSSTFSVANSGGNAGTLNETSMSSISIGSGNSASLFKIQSDIYVGDNITAHITSSSSTNYHSIVISSGSKSNTFISNTKSDYICQFSSSVFNSWFSSTVKMIEATITCTTYSSGGSNLGSVSQKVYIHLHEYQYKPAGGSGKVSSESITSCTIALTRPTFKNSATFSKWNVSSNIGTAAVSGNTVTVSGLSSVSNTATGVLTVTCMDSRGFVSDPIYVVFHIRRSGFYVYDGTWVHASPILYNNGYKNVTAAVYNSEWKKYRWDISTYNTQNSIIDNAIADNTIVG